MKLSSYISIEHELRDDFKIYLFSFITANKLYEVDE